MTDEVVADRIDGIRGSMGSWETVERPPEIGDLLNLDARGVVEGEEFWSREDGVLYLDEEGSVPVTGFPQAMAGVEPGQEDRVYALDSGRFQRRLDSRQGGVFYCDHK